MQRWIDISIDIDAAVPAGTVIIPLPYPQGMLGLTGESCAHSDEFGPGCAGADPSPRARVLGLLHLPLHGWAAALPLLPEATALPRALENRKHSHLQGFLSGDASANKTGLFFFALALRSMRKVSSPGFVPHWGGCCACGALLCPGKTALGGF